MKKRGNMKRVGIFGMILTLMLTVALALQTQSSAQACSYFKKVSMKKCAISLESKIFNYTGAAIMPNVKVEYNGQTLVQNKDFTVKYSKNINPGIGKVTVKGTGDYRSKQTLTFQIAQAPVNNEVHVNIYSGNDNADGFVVNSAVVNELTAENLIEKLKNIGSVANNVQVLGFEDNGSSLVLNLSQAFADDVSSTGTAGEYIKVGCVVNTFVEAFEAEQITILVNGAAWESGHSVYDAPLSKFEEESTDVEVNIYTGNNNADGFIVNPMFVSEVTPENLIQELQIVGAVATGVQVRGFRDMGTHLILDLSSEFASDVSSSGSAGEYIKVGCVVNTFLDAYNKSEIMITVEDQPWESGHAIYDNTLTRFN